MSDFAIKASFSARQFVCTIFPFNEISIETDVLRVSFSTDRLHGQYVIHELFFVLFLLRESD